MCVCVTANVCVRVCMQSQCGVLQSNFCAAFGNCKLTTINKGTKHWPRLPSLPFSPSTTRFSPDIAGETWTAFTHTHASTPVYRYSCALVRNCAIIAFSWRRCPKMYAMKNALRRFYRHLSTFIGGISYRRVNSCWFTAQRGACHWRGNWNLRGLSLKLIYSLIEFQLFLHLTHTHSLPLFLCSFFRRHTHTYLEPIRAPQNAANFRLNQSQFVTIPK